MFDMTYNKSFGSGLTAFNEVRKRIDYNLDELFVFFYRSVLRKEALTWYKNMTQYGNFPGYGNFQDMEGLVLKRVEIYVEIKDMEIFQTMEIILDIEDKHHTLLHSTTIGRIKQIYRQAYSTSITDVSPKPNDLL